jgi:twinkle protein
MTEISGSFVQHESCPECGSKDNLARYSDGNGYCFGCNHFERGEDSTTTVSTETRRSPMKDMVEFDIAPLAKRAIKEATCKKWHYGVGTYRGTPVQVANYHDSDGKVIAQKLRFPNKDFMWLGDPKKAGLWGQHLWGDKGKMVTITEGEIDALTVSQLFDLKWPVVSVPNGAASAAKTISENLKWLEEFDTVVLAFDQDDAGRKAAHDCAMLLSPGKAKIVVAMPHKDPNDCLTAGAGSELISSIWGAKTYRPDGVVPGEDLWDVLMTNDAKESIPYPWNGFNSKLFGIRGGELVTLTSGTGIGKSSVCRELAYWLMQQGAKVGYIALEESVKRTAEGIMGIYLNKPPHLWKDAGVEEEMKREAFDHSVGSGRMVLYDHWGSCDSDNLLNQIRYMTRAMGCTHIFLDHLSIVVSGLESGDERRMIDNTMTKLRSLVEETGAALFLVSHLKRPDGRGHEEGATTSLSQLRGSHAIAQLSDAVIGFERNQQDEATANLLTCRVLKNRYAGETGIASQVEYERDSGRLHEWLPEEVVGVQEVSEGSIPGH